MASYSLLLTASLDITEHVWLLHLNVFPSACVAIACLDWQLHHKPKLEICADHYICFSVLKIGGLETGGSGWVDEWMSACAFRFLKTSPVEALYNFVDVKGPSAAGPLADFQPGTYLLVASRPRKVHCFDCWPRFWLDALICARERESLHLTAAQPAIMHCFASHVIQKSSFSCHRSDVGMAMSHPSCGSLLCSANTQIHVWWNVNVPSYIGVTG